MNSLLLSHLMLPNAQSWGDSLIEEDELQQQFQQQAEAAASNNNNDSNLASELNMLAEASRDGINAMMTKVSFN